MKERIKEAREARGWSRERLAVELGCGERQVRKWEVGGVMPRADTVVAIADALGVSTRWLITGEDPSQEAA